MKLSLLACGLSALSLVAASPAAPVPEENGTCTNTGSYDPNDGPCSFTVTCGSPIASGAKVLGTHYRKDTDNCIQSCYNADTGSTQLCQGVTYQVSTGTCTQYGGEVSTGPPTKGFNSATLNGCG